MDESIRNAEKLIQATNTALACMLNDVSYDDFEYKKGSDDYSDRKKNWKEIWELEEQIFQDFLPRKENIPTKSEHFFLDRENSKESAKIDEINNKIELYKEELLEREERETLRALLFDNELVTLRGMERIVPATKTASDPNISQKSVPKPKLPNTADDLKSKIIQTQKIVDRGIQTARELNETVDILKAKPPKTDRYDEVSLAKSKSLDKLAKSDSRSSVDMRKCKKCNNEIKRKSKQRGERKKENFSVMKIVGDDGGHGDPLKCKKLHLQKLPSLNIQGDLSCQKIPSVDIPPGKREFIPVRMNTAFATYSHDDILKEQYQRIANVQKSHCYINTENCRNIMCSNCGNILRLCDKPINSSQLDDLLRKCDYNVFDPRIDEFVDRCGIKADENAKFTQTDDEFMQKTPRDELSKFAVHTKSVNSPIADRNLKISELSNKVMRKYREETAELESGHLQFENVFRDLFQTVDESRAFFKQCNYLNSVADEKPKASLSMTETVVVSFPGMEREADDVRKRHRSKISAKDLMKKSEKRELKKCLKLLPSAELKFKTKPGERGNFLPKSDCASETDDSSTSEIKLRKELENQNIINLKNTISLPVMTREGLNTDSEPNRPQIYFENKNALPSTSHEKPTAVPEMKRQNNFNNVKPLPSKLQEEVVIVPNQSPPPVPINLDVVEETTRHSKTESEYESDFEDETLDEQLAIDENMETDGEEQSVKLNTRLSTISEVDSEQDPKVADSAVEDKDKPFGLIIGNDGSKDRESGQDTAIALATQSSDEEDTRKLLKKVNKELREVAQQQLICTKLGEKTSKPINEPLKEVLDALKNQFERTEILADKLTKKIKEVNDVKKSEIIKENCYLTHIPNIPIVNNLEKLRNSFENKLVFSPRADILRNLHDNISEDSSEGGLQMSATNRDKHNITNNHLAGGRTPIKSLAKDESYSEGEISEHEVLSSEGNSPSIGEVINENESDGYEDYSGEKSQ